MRTTRTLTLELLRHGPPHNQLLSPLTPYLALAGNHGAQTVYLPFEHRDFLLRQRVLRYQEGRGAQDPGEVRESTEARIAHLREMGRLLSEVLADIPGLNTDLGATAHRPDELVHLRLVLSASELSLLPFEAALSPAGAPGAGAPMALQTTLPLSITRQARRHPGALVRWPTRPRILLAIASPPGVRHVPDLAHVTALRKALAPWIHPREDNPKQDNTSDMLTVLTEVSLEKLQRACSHQPYTHVHILAHGKARASVGGEQFCLAFHHDQDPRQEVLVDGEQLASALRTHADSAEGGMSHPAVVSIAACDAGNPGSVIVPGASLAHTLHEHGVPLVVASQYPLTFQGSVVMASILYERLLWGHDPRVVLHDVRQRLRLLDSAYHDWASIVAYAGFPPDLDAQLRKARLDMAALAAAAVLARTDSELLRPDSKSLRRGHDDLSQALEVMEKVLPEPGEAAATRAKFLGRCGSLEKRRAHVLDQEKRNKPAASPEPAASPRPTGEVRGILQRSRDYYWRGMKEQLSNHWLISQYLSLQLLLDGELSTEWLTVGRVAAQQELASSDLSVRGWALGSLLELELLATRTPGLGDKQKQECWQRAKRYTKELVELMGRDSFHVHSTRRQLKRYRDWWKPWLPELAEPATELVRDMGEEVTQSPEGFSRSEVLNPYPYETDEPL
jgi:hypothetical protein